MLCVGALRHGRVQEPKRNFKLLRLDTFSRITLPHRRFARVIQWRASELVMSCAGGCAARDAACAPRYCGISIAEDLHRRLRGRPNACEKSSQADERLLQECLLRGYAKRVGKDCKLVCGIFDQMTRHVNNFDQILPRMV